MGDERARKGEKVKRLTADLLTAIELRRGFYQRQFDRKFQDEVGAIYYAIDSNVLHNRYTNPLDSSMAPSNWNHGVFSGPMRDDRTDSEKQVFDILYEYILSSLNSGPEENQRLLVLPGHSHETRGVMRGLVQRSTSSKASEDQETLERHFLNLDRLNDSVDRDGYLDAHNGEIHKLLRQIERPHALFREFVERLSNGRYTSLRNLFHDPDFRDVLQFGQFARSVWNVEERSTAIPLTKEMEQWSKALDNEQTKGRRRNDTLALSAVEKLNSYFHDQGKRVVLITSSEDILAAGRTIFPLRHDSEENGRLSFADLYLRSPLAFLFDRDVIVPSKSHHGNHFKATWSDVWLGELWETSHKDLVTFQDELEDGKLPNRIRQKAKAVIEVGSKVHEDLNERWNNHMHVLNRAHNSTSEHALTNVRSLLGNSAIEDIGFFKSFSKHMERTATESWNSFFLAAAHSGFDFIGVREFHSTHPRRSVPTILIIENEYGVDALAAINSSSSTKQIEAKLEGLLDGLPLGNAGCDYIRALIYALLFSLAERWEVAKTIAVRSTEIALDLVDATDGLDLETTISGREGFYLSAVLTRLTAKSEHDLTAGGTYLELADSALKREAGVKQIVERQRLTGVRFRCEEISIDTARLFFSVQKAKWQVDTNSSSKIIEGSRAIIKAANHVLKEIDKCSHDHVRDSCRLDTRTNLFSVSFLLNTVGASDVDDLKKVTVEAQFGELHAKFPDLAEKGQGISHIDMFMLMYAAKRVGFEDSGLAGMKRRMREFSLGKTKICDFSVMPYDKIRFERILDFVIDHRPLN